MACPYADNIRALPGHGVPHWGPDMRRDYPYVILGGGMTAASAVKGIREVSADLPIGIIGAENHPPYNRPPLSKGLWKGKPVEKIWRGTDSVPGVSLHLGRRAISLDTAAKIVRDDGGDEYGYGKLLLALGGTPRRLPFGGDRVIYFRTFDNYQKLRQAARPGTKLAVIGGGFIGSEVAAALRGTGADVSLYFPDAGIGARIFPSDLSQNLNEYYREQGVDVRAGERVMMYQAAEQGDDDECGNEEALDRTHVRTYALGHDKSSYGKRTSAFGHNYIRNASLFREEARLRLSSF